MAELIALNKPFEVLCQFSDDGSGKRTLADMVDVPNVYPAGRLDFKSEGLVLLTDSGRLQHRLSHPDQKLAKRYLVQVEGEPGSKDFSALLNGVEIREHGFCVGERILILLIGRWIRIPAVDL